MIFWVEIDAKLGARLHLMLASADRKHRHLASFEVVVLEVEVFLLRVLLAGPLLVRAEVEPHNTAGLGSELGGPC
jgi:hypothetical protein